jgi:hypothetical protein
VNKHGGKHKSQTAKAILTKLPSPSRRELLNKAYLAKWSKVDWSKQNVVLAAETGLTQERIRQIRIRVGAPKSPHQHRCRRTHLRIQWAKDNLDKLKGLTWAELRQKYGLTPHWHCGPFYEFIKPLLRDGRLIRKRPWDLMNFRLPNRDLQRIWRLPYKTAGSYRYLKQLPLSTWCFSGPRYTHFTKRQLQAYHRTVKAEERKAAKFFAQICEGTPTLATTLKEKG